MKTSTVFTIKEQNEIDIELMSMVTKHNLRFSVGAFLAIVFMLLVIVQHHESLQWVLIWLLLAVAAQVCRIVSSRELVSTNPTLIHAKKKNYLRSAACISATHVLYFVLFFLKLSDSERCFITLLMLGLCSASVINNAGLRAGFINFALPTIAVTVYFWFMSDFSTVSYWLQKLMALMIGFYGFVLNEMSKNTYHILQETYALRFEDRQKQIALHKALDNAELANKTKTRFLAAASHDLRQPLHTISLVSAALELQNLRPETKKLVNLLNQVSITLSKQLNDLLDISKLDAGIIEVKFQSLGINSLVSNVASEFELEILEKGLDLELDLQANEEISTDPELMYRLLRNLLHNAIKFTQNGKITLRTSKRHSKIIVEVIDTGCGIGHQYQEEVFQEFYQVNNANRDRAKGFGLGLSIVVRLAKLLDIKVGLHSEVGAGSNFYLVIPACAQNSSLQREMHSTVGAVGEHQFSINVLVIEDDELVKHATKLLLESLGCVCFEASNTQSAIEVGKLHQLDLIIADFRLGKHDNGVLAIQAVNQGGLIDSVLVTGDTEPYLLKEIESSGLSVIHKPVTFERLFHVLKAAESRKLARAAHTKD